MNLNTPKFWDRQFDKEWQLIHTKDKAGTMDGYRWDYLRYGVIGFWIPFRGKLLDIGCGIGNFCRYIKARNYQLKVYGIDFSKKAIRYSKKTAKNIKFKVGDAYKLPFKDNYFDVVVAQEVIEHLESPDNAVIEWLRVLKSGGIMIITTPRRESEQLCSQEHLFEWTIKEFSSFCYRYFKENVEMIFPPAIINIAKKETTIPHWILAICIKK